MRGKIRNQGLSTRAAAHADFLHGDGVGLACLAVLAHHAAQLLVRLRSKGALGRPAVRKLPAQPANVFLHQVTAADMADARIGGPLEIEITLCGPAGLDVVEDGVQLCAGQQ
jgi:hypothetical protein